MPIKIIRDDITRVECDAVVNAANRSLLGGGGVDGAVHKAAGKMLDKACAALGGCDTGKAKITPGFKMPCKYIIHTVGPVYIDGKHNEAALLKSCYASSLSLAEKYHCSSVAFPLISTGAYHYPKKAAFKIAVDTINDFLDENSDMLVYIVLYDSDAFLIGKSYISDIEKYIDDCYVEENYEGLSDILYGINACGASETAVYGEPVFEAYEIQSPLTSSAKDQSLDEALDNIDESFSQMLLRKIDEKHMSDSQCYKKANIDRKHFSKIRSNINYKPSKPTAIAFALALELSLDETKELLMKAGFALSHSNKFDIIVEYFIKNKNYNLFELNEALYSFDQSLIGM